MSPDPSWAQRPRGVARRRGRQCDPFDDGYDPLAIAGSSFTVQNGVACGQHWTDLVTFRFDPRRGAFLFRTEISQSWTMNRSDAPDADPLVADPASVVHADPGKPVTFDEFHRP